MAAQPATAGAGGTTSPIGSGSASPAAASTAPGAVDEPLVPVGLGKGSKDAGDETSGGPAADDGPMPVFGASPAASGQPADSGRIEAADNGDEAASGERLSSNARIDALLKRYRAGERVAARTELNRMLQTARDTALNRELRRHLAKIADEMIFSRDFAPGDPLVARHILGDGEYLIHVQNEYAVPYPMIMRINGIKDPGRVRAGQALKVPRGPFHAVIHRGAFRLDLYLQDLYVKSFPVGLGAFGSTPLGDWVVKDRLKNPTYYPTASATIKRIIGPDDPENPLGEYWVGLKGIGGGAVGQVGYGIHGTIDPSSIGKNESLGCVRMLDDDIEFVFNALLPGKSKVKTVP